VIPVIAELKARARILGLWNLFLSKAHYPKYGVPLSNLEVGVSKRRPHFLTTSVTQYAVMAEVLGGGGSIASETVNCSAPDTGNMGGPHPHFFVSMRNKGLTGSGFVSIDSKGL